MLIEEFIARTKVQVTYDEYLTINAMYNYSDVDKDEFCRLWCKMNPNRVAEAKAMLKERDRMEKIQAKVWRLYEKCISRFYPWEEAIDCLTDTEQGFLKSLGIKIGFANMGSVNYEMKKYATQSI